MHLFAGNAGLIVFRKALYALPIRYASLAAVGKIRNLKGHDDVEAGQASVVTAEAILAHPGFHEAKRAHLRSLTTLFLQDLATTRLMRDAGTITLRALLVGFHANHRDDVPESYATVRRIQNIIVARGLASRRRVDHLIQRFRQVGYVDYSPAPGDRRARLLRPTQFLIEHDRAHLQAYHRFLHVLYPTRGYHWDDEETHLAIRLIALQRLDQAMAFMGHRSFRTLLDRDAGYLAFVMVADAAVRGEEENSSFSSLARRLRVSRNHIRNLFLEAEQMGLVEIGGTRTKTVRILPRLWQAYDHFLADIHAGQDAISQIAFRTMNEGGDKGPVANA